MTESFSLPFSDNAVVAVILGNDGWSCFVSDREKHDIQEKADFQKSQGNHELIHDL